MIYEGKKDAILVFISSQIPSTPSDTDIMITTKDKGFKKTGLKMDSVIKLDKIATVLKDLIIGELGELDKEIKQKINRKLSKILTL